MLWVSVSSQVTPRYPPVVSTEAVCKFGEAGQDAGFPLCKVYSGAESKPSLCSSGRGQWTGKAQASRSGKFAAGPSANPLCATPGRDNGRARSKLPALLWKVCSGAECKLSLCSRCGQCMGKVQASRYGKFAAGQSANPLCAVGRDSGLARRWLPALESF